jgi:hypothetical protein
VISLYLSVVPVLIFRFVNRFNLAANNRSPSPIAVHCIVARSTGRSVIVRDTSDCIISLQNCDKNVSGLIKITDFRDVTQCSLVDVTAVSEQSTVCVPSVQSI